MLTFTSTVCGGLQAQLRNDKYDMPWHRLLILVLAVQPGSSKWASAFPNFQLSTFINLTTTRQQGMRPQCASLSGHSMPESLFQGYTRHKDEWRSWPCTFSFYWAVCIELLTVPMAGRANAPRHPTQRLSIKAGRVHVV